jgi:hypothetical protein
VLVVDTTLRMPRYKIRCKGCSHSVGHEVRAVHDGTEAIEVATRFFVADVVLTRPRLWPGLSG